MLHYFIRRLFLVIPAFLGITLLIFAITRLVPGGPVERMLASMHSQMDGGVSLSQSGESSALSQDQLAELNAFYGLDQPVTTAYINWLTKLVTLDLGEYPLL